MTTQCRQASVEYQDRGALVSFQNTFQESLVEIARFRRAGVVPPPKNRVIQQVSTFNSGPGGFNSGSGGFNFHALKFVTVCVWYMLPVLRFVVSFTVFNFPQWFRFFNSGSEWFQHWFGGFNFSTFGSTVVQVFQQWFRVVSTVVWWFQLFNNGFNSC